MYRLRYDCDYFVSKNLRLRYDYDYFLNKIHDYDYDYDYSLFVIDYNRLRLRDYDYSKSGVNMEVSYLKDRESCHFRHMTGISFLSRQE